MSIPRMNYRQYRKARKLTHECCNYCDGNCLLLDDGEEAEHRARGRSVGGVEGPHAVKGPVDQAVAVQDHELHEKGPPCSGK